MNSFFTPENDTNIRFADRSIRDAFGRVRVSEPETLFESKFLYSKNPLQWGELLSNSATATYNGNQSVVDMAVTSTVGSRVVRQTYRYIPYQSGKSQLILMTGVLQVSGGTSGIRSRIGHFDNASDKSTGVINGNGFFFQLNGTTLSVVKRSYITGSQVDTTINQSSWNIDKFDGTGPSGITLDPSKSQIFIIDKEWLGVGTVRMGFVIDGLIYYCHSFHHANIITSTYAGNPNLPIRYELENVSSSSSAQMKQICCTVISEGGYNLTGASYSVNEGNNESTISTTEQAVISVRALSTHNRISFKVINLNAILTSAGSVIWRLYHDAQFSSGPTGWTNLSSTSSLEFALNGTFTGGQLISSGYLFVGGGFFGSGGNGLSSALNSNIFTSANINGTRQISTLTFQSFSGSETISSSMDCQEYL